MAASLPERHRSEEVRASESIGLKPAKAALDRAPRAGTADPLDCLSRIVESALVQAHGSRKAAAITMAKDQSQMTRQLRLGTLDLRDLAAAGGPTLAALGDLLTDEFGSTRKSARQVALERLPELIRAVLVLTDQRGTERRTA